MNISRRELFALLGAGTAAAAFPGCCLQKHKPRHMRAKIALQLYSLHKYIASLKMADGKVDLARALDQVSAIGYKGVEFAGYYDYTPKELRKMLADAGLKACGTHVGTTDFGVDTKAWTYDPDVLKKTCEFNLGYGNNLIICPGGGNMPTGVTWSKQRDVVPSREIDDFTKRLCDHYNKAADEAAKFGCQIGLHNHQWEFFVKLTDGTTFWDYFFSHTHPKVCMEQDVGWTTCAGYDPCTQYLKYSHRSPTLHAKENGMGDGVEKFDAILGRPGCDKDGNLCATPVDWDALIPVSEKDGVQWYVVECEQHFEDLSAVRPSYDFLKSKGLN